MATAALRLAQHDPGAATAALGPDPAPGLLERHAHRTSYGALIADIVSRLAGRAHAQSAGPQPLLEPLRDSEIRVLRYLPTNLTLPEIARELRISHNTVKTHTRSLPGNHPDRAIGCSSRPGSGSQ
jgi:DNA-binding NarL/FixJ family response regulator